MKYQNWKMCKECEECKKNNVIFQQIAWKAEQIASNIMPILIQLDHWIRMSTVCIMHITQYFIWWYVSHKLSYNQLKKFIVLKLKCINARIFLILGWVMCSSTLSNFQVILICTVSLISNLLNIFSEDKK